MDVNRLAHSLHRRRLSNNPNAPRHQAAGEARFFGTYGIEPQHDYYDHYMNVQMELPYGGALTVLTGTNGTYEIFAGPMLAVDYLVFTRGERLADTEVIGWLPSYRAAAAPATGNGSTVLVSDQCIFPMPEGNPLDEGFFTEPQINVPGVWDYDLQAMWTPLGYHVYDGVKARTVQMADKEKMK